MYGAKLIRQRPLLPAPASATPPLRPASDAQPAPETPRAARWSGFFHLGVLYVVWGSTYFAIRVAVGPGGGFPPFWMGFLRMATAGLLLLLVFRLLGRSIGASRRDLGLLAISGVLLFVGGNGLVMLAETSSDSNYAALLVAATPMWVAGIEALIDRRVPSWRTVVALLTGFGGIAVLSAPRLMAGGSAEVLPVVALLGACLSWSCGLVLQQRRKVSLHPVVSAGYQQVFGAVGFAIVALLLAEPMPTPSTDAWLAWGYLTVFGSLLAFTSFVLVVRSLPASIVTTYAYVNPVIAVLLGAWLLDEPVTGWTVGGAALVLAAVAGIFRERARAARPAAR